MARYIDITLQKRGVTCVARRGSRVETAAGMSKV